jgi:hypothetical protein
MPRTIRSPASEFHQRCDQRLVATLVKAGKHGVIGKA